MDVDEAQTIISLRQVKVESGFRHMYRSASDLSPEMGSKMDTSLEA